MDGDKCKDESPGVWGLGGEGRAVRQVSIVYIDYIIVLIKL